LTMFLEPGSTRRTLTFSLLPMSVSTVGRGGRAFLRTLRGLVPIEEAEPSPWGPPKCEVVGVGGAAPGSDISPKTSFRRLGFGDPN
jgi:hypothetical protein